MSEDDPVNERERLYVSSCWKTFSPITNTIVPNAVHPVLPSVTEQFNLFRAAPIDSALHQVYFLAHNSMVPHSNLYKHKIF